MARTSKSELETAALRFRKALETRERFAFSRLSRAYTDAFGRLQGDLDRVLERIETARLEGTAVSPAWLYQQERYAALQVQLGRELRTISRELGIVVKDEGQAAIDLADQHARGMVDVQLAAGSGITSSWQHLNTGAVKQALAFQASDGPLADLLEGVVSHGLERVGGAIVEGIIAGDGPRETARRVSQAFGTNQARALTIVRTETMRAYREGTRQAYGRNPQLVKAWTWVSALDRRTCPACWAMHGTVHKVDEQLDGHPSCRCVMAPVTATYQELGIDAPEPKGMRVEKGEATFRKLDAGEQARILGPAKFELYRNGELELRDLVHRPGNPVWGTMRREASVRQALGNAGRRGDRSAAAKARHEDRRLARRLRGKDDKAPIGPMTEQEWRRAAAARLKEIDAKWDKFSDQLAPVFSNIRGEASFRTRENAKAALQEAGVTRSGRRSGASGAKSTRRMTVKAELRQAGERAALQFLADHPDEPLVKHVVGLLDEAEALRDALEATRNAEVGFLGHDFF
jgi:SPP1 gp7 family putative phage head morphogenesis protein